MINKEEELKKKIFKLIDDKKASMMVLEDHLDFVSNIIKDLNDFIDKKKNFTEVDIESMLANLVQYRVVLDIPLPKDTLLLRGVRIADGLSFPKNVNLDRISYIPKDKTHLASLGRCNKKGFPMYYACVANSIRDVNAPFSEINAKDNEHINILISNTSQNLNVRFVGLYDYYQRGTKPPFEVHGFFEEVHQYYIDTHDKALLLAIELCDSFFCDILRRKGNDRVYEVTSILSYLYISGKEVDGLIYPSVETEGFPNVVIRPSSVDDKILHKEVKIFLIKKDYGYSKYHAVEFNTIGKINGNDISWSDTIA